MPGSPALCPVLVFGQSKTCVDIGIIGPEPVAVRAAQHAGSRNGRPTFQYVVLVIEEIFGVPGINWHRLKSGKRAELRRRPLPAISNQLGDPTSAVARRMGIHV